MSFFKSQYLIFYQMHMYSFIRGMRLIQEFSRPVSNSQTFELIVKAAKTQRGQL